MTIEKGMFGVFLKEQRGNVKVQMLAGAGWCWLVLTLGSFFDIPLEE